MITARLCGGLGARLFQIAAAYVLAIDNNDECAFNLNMGSLAQGVKPEIYRNNAFRKLKNLPDDWKEGPYYQELRYNYDPIPYQANLTIGGYYGSEKYFNHRRKEIIKLIGYGKLFKASIGLDFTNSVSLHVRRGDYLINASHVCDKWYYINALKRIVSQTQIDHIYIVSDDIPWCKETFRDKRIKFISGVPDYIDFYIQTFCNHNIIANSTFSRMATFLNTNEDKIVIAPAVWYGGYLANQITDVFDNNWIFI